MILLSSEPSVPNAISAATSEACLGDILLTRETLETGDSRLVYTTSCARNAMARFNKHLPRGIASMRGCPILMLSSRG